MGLLMGREIIDFGNEFLLQYVSEWSAGHTPFDEPKMIGFSRGVLVQYASEASAG